MCSPRRRSQFVSLLDCLDMMFLNRIWRVFQAFAVCLLSQCWWNDESRARRWEGHRGPGLHFSTATGRRKSWLLLPSCEVVLLHISCFGEALLGNTAGKPPFIHYSALCASLQISIRILNRYLSTRRPDIPGRVSTAACATFLLFIFKFNSCLCFSNLCSYSKAHLAMLGRVRRFEGFWEREGSLKILSKIFHL